MADTMHLLKTQILKLMPFFNAVVIYFAFVQDPKGELWTTTLKCLPIGMLMFYVVAKGFALTPAYRRSQRILLGLIGSCAGDALLSINLFPQGMGAFAIGHIWYISAFGWKPLKLSIGVTLYILGAVGISVVFKRLDAVLAVGLPIYAALLLTTCWRALARALQSSSFIDTFCAVGAVLFLISDIVIGINMFLISVPYSRIFIMSTYYTAQFAITLSTANESPESWKHMGNGKPALKGNRAKTKD
ncbi:lysoplasmalogenase-like protein TMEM86A [Anastrepha ludens]|uniref:lysoplasmalogenase-like protein TMEM86A n=1 Tax=Anastrepha ludens TaxID=28586 RepID=UPI0023B1860F|nr:lysoplasmalogenase-like protein TMEM86A [Anastrepha ludens]XP_053946865.1 lysoplasmalogenase-like protein TMEM86A [Anastrepha ludens]